MVLDYLLVLILALFGGAALGQYQKGDECLLIPCLVLGVYLPLGAWISLSSFLSEVL